MNPYVKSVQPLDDISLEILSRTATAHVDAKPYLYRGSHPATGSALFAAARVVAAPSRAGRVDLSYDTLYWRVSGRSRPSKRRRPPDSGSSVEECEGDGRP